MSFWSNWQYDIIGSDNGLMSNRRQTIIWSNDGMFYGRIYASLGLNGLSFSCEIALSWMSRDLTDD